MTVLSSVLIVIGLLLIAFAVWPTIRERRARATAHQPAAGNDPVADER